MKRLRPVCRSCGVQLVTGHKDDPEYHWEWCRRKTLRGRLGRGNAGVAFATGTSPEAAFAAAFGLAFLVLAARGVALAADPAAWHYVTHLA